MTPQELGDFLNSRINKKDPSPTDLAMLREVMELSPTYASAIGNIAYQARRQLIEKIAVNKVVEEQIQAELSKLQNDMGYQEAPALERMLIEQIGVCWLLLYRTQQGYTAMILGGDITFAMADWYERRLAAVQGRFLRAVETLAKLRNLAKPTLAQTVMLNVARQQINAALTSK